MKGIVSFLKFNNAVPLTVTFLMVGAASTYAATNPETFVQKEEKVISIDNTYIAKINLKSYTPTAQVTAVREDDDFYYVEYTFKTIALTDHVWQKVTTQETMQVGKKRLGGHRDLGLFVTDQLRQKIANELARLKETQTIEKKNISQKKVATVYSGLIGGFIDSKTTTIAGYEPVVELPEKEPEEQTFARPDPDALKKKEEALKKKLEEEKVQQEALKEAEEQQEEVTNEPKETETPIQTGTSTVKGTTTSNTTNNTGSGGGSTNEEAPTSTPNQAPTLTILGENPVRIAIGATYTDLGATVSDDHDTINTVEVYVNGVQVDSVVLDTSATGTYEIMYESADSEGSIAQKIRIVEVYDLAPIVEEPEPEVEKSTTTPETEPEQVPEEVPDEEPEEIIEPEPEITNASSS